MNWRDVGGPEKEQEALPEKRAPRHVAGHARGRTTKPPARSSIRIKRVYDALSRDDGLNILVDRIWPRGMSKAKLAPDIWPKHLAPSSALRGWYGHDPERWAEFRRRYLAELEQQRDGLAALRAALRGRKATLLTATRELDRSHAKVLREALTGRR